MRPEPSPKAAPTSSTSVPRPVLIALALLAAGGCRTRPWEFGLSSDAGPTVRDLSVPRDLRIADLTFFPDLVPPPDLIPPRYCGGIFVFDEDKRFSFFDPIKLTFVDLAKLACPVKDVADTPFSMAVGRDGAAWVEYDSGDLFRVNTTTGACAATNFAVGQKGFGTFGMGFASDGVGSPNETLYVANITQNGMGEARLGSIDLQTLVLTPIGPLPGAAELTGTGAGELWGFFGSMNPHVEQIDKVSGKALVDIPLPQLGNAGGSGYAFGTFGGEFYIFIFANGGSTNVHRLHAADGTLTRVLANTGRHIVGAGVSTCAPQM